MVTPYNKAKYCNLLNSQIMASCSILLNHIVKWYFSCKCLVQKSTQITNIRESIALPIVDTSDEITSVLPVKLSLKHEQSVCEENNNYCIQFNIFKIMSVML